MRRLLPRKVVQAVEWMGKVLDPFFAGRWYWSLKRWIAERRLHYALEHHGDRSMQARRATERYRHADFAVRYWRSAPGPVMRVAEQAMDAGVPMHAIRLLVLNADLQIRNGQVHLRRPFIVTLLNAVFATIVGVHMVLMCVMAVTAPGPTWLKVVVILAVACVYCFLYYGWSLYTSRPQNIIAEYGQKLDAICIASTTQSRAEVRHIAPR